MSKIDKIALKQIAKRWAKGLIIHSEASIHFEYSGFTEEEYEYLEDELIKIANRITELPHANDSQSLIDEYYEKN